MYQANRWHTDDRFLAPMHLQRESGQHIYAGDIVTLEEQEITAKVVKFFTILEVQLLALVLSKE